MSEDRPMTPIARRWPDPPTAQPLVPGCEPTPDEPGGMREVLESVAFASEIEAIQIAYAHHPPAMQATIDAHEHVRRVLSNAACQIAATCAPGRYRSLALTALEQSRLWANTSVAVDGPRLEPTPSEGP